MFVFTGARRPEGAMKLQKCVKFHYPVPVDESNRLLFMSKLEVPRPPSGGTRSIWDELNDYMGEAETDFRRLWINPKFANFKMRRLARKICAQTATSVPS